MADDSPLFNPGDRIIVVQGPYTDFKGIVVHAAPAPGKVGVKLAFFGRKAQVTLDATAVAPSPTGHQVRVALRDSRRDVGPPQPLTAPAVRPEIIRR
jgi:hypothetical protein